MKKKWYFEKDHRICTNFIYCASVAEGWLHPCYHSKPHICEFPSMCSKWGMAKTSHGAYNIRNLDGVPPTPKCIKLKKKKGE